MKGKNLIIILLITIALVGTFFLIRKKDIQNLEASQTKIGTKFLPDLQLDKIISLKISSGEDLKADIRKADDKWLVVNLYNYPVNPSKLRSFTLDLSEMKVLKAIDAPEKELSRFGLDPNNDSFKPVKIEMEYNDGTKKEFLAGKRHVKTSSSDFGGDITEGRFLKSNSAKIAVSDKTLYQLEDEAADWIDKEFFSAQKLKKASLGEGNKILWTLLREKENDDMKLENIPEGREADSSKISEISSALSYLSFAKIADPKTNDEISGLSLEKAKIFTAEDFDGIRYKFLIGNKENNDYYVKVSAEFAGIEKPAPPENEKEEDKEKREKEFSEKEKKAKEKVKEINTKYAQWIYLFAEHKIKTLTTTQEELLKKLEEKSEENNKSDSKKKNTNDDSNTE